jgi:hypothetical protein
LLPWADFLAISLPASSTFLCLPALYFFACQPYISLLPYTDVLAISLPASSIFLPSHAPISLLP